jgi:Putative lumazine-binding
MSRAARVFVKFIMEGPASTPGTSYNAGSAVLEVAFDIAVVKVVDDWLGERYTDYLTMLKHDDKWSILNKAFTVHPPM